MVMFHHDGDLNDDYVEEEGQEQQQQQQQQQKAQHQSPAAPSFDLSQFPPEQIDELMKMVGGVLEANDINLEEIPEEHHEEIINDVLTQIVQQMTEGGDD
jgi:hypothetical protein